MGINRIVIDGNLVEDAEVKTFESGSSITTFSIAVNDRGYTTKNGHVIEDRVDYFNCVMRGDKLAQYFKKGNQLMVSGKMKSRMHDKKVYWTLHVDEFDFGRRAQVREYNNHDIPPPPPTRRENQGDQEDDLPF